MGFFDLNIPYHEPSKTLTKSSIEANRTKLVVKAMELGYTGIAYNRTIKGVMSDHHRCSITPLSLSSLLKVLPSLSLSAKLHRDLLRIPLSTPFRQYTRLTVVVDNPSHVQALNSGNPILKTYDLVAVKPTNQHSFDLCCERMEVDIITIDFSSRLQFRLKQSMVAAATKRGICFEVSYSGLIADIQSRRNLISGAKMLMEWARGRYVIFSSAASSVNELRGPCDVANLLSLFGLTKERAKEVISKNCRNLLENALRKKLFYKEAIRIELLPLETASRSKEDQYQELLKWDPISSYGDILLDDLAKSLSSFSKASKTAKAIDFVSVVDSIPSCGFCVKDFLPASNASPVSPADRGNLPVAEKVSQSTVILNNTIEQLNMHDVYPEQEERFVCDPIGTHQAVMTMTVTTIKSFADNCSELRRSNNTLVRCNKFSEKIIQSATSETCNSKEERDTPISATELELKNSIDLDVGCTRLEAKAHDAQSNLCISSNTMDDRMPYENEKLRELSKYTKLVDGHNIDHKVDFFTPSIDTTFPSRVHDEYVSEKSSDVNLNAKFTKMQDAPPSEDLRIVEDNMVSEINTSISEILMMDAKSDEVQTDAVELDDMPQQTPYDEMMTEVDSAVATCILPDVMMEDQNLGEASIQTDKDASVQSASGRRRVKRKTPRGALRFPFKPFLNPLSFKKRGKRNESRIKLKKSKNKDESSK